MVRLWMSLGRNQGLRPKDVVGAIAGESGIAGRAIGSIEISGTFSLVEIPEDSVDQVIRSMKGAKIRGKSVTVRRDRA
jgi:ATP-dependent RNA helicase DeaD